MEKSSDVIVVGGGPCGSFTALNLAKLGLNVGVLEEHSEIGAPSHCAGHLSIKGLKLLGLYPLPSKIVENAFCGAVFHSPKGKKFSVHFSSPVTCSVNRALFDKYMAQMAENAGAHYFLNSMGESLILENGYAKGVIVRRGEAQERFLAKMVIDAEGLSARILRQAGLLPSNSQMLVKAVEAEVENVKGMEMDIVEIFLGKNYAPGFYAWLMPKRDGKAKVGLAGKVGNPRELLRRLMIKHPTASEKLRSAKILQSSLHSITLGGPIPRTYSNGFLAVGDAASQVKPTTGGGVIFGMTCAGIAADVACKAVRRNDLSSDFLRMYQSQCNKKLQSEVRFMLGIRKVLDALSDEKTDDVVDFCAKIGLDRVFRNFEDIDFQGRSILRTLWNPRIAIALSYFLLLYLLANR